MSFQAITLIPIRFYTALNRKPNFQSLQLTGIVEEEEERIPQNVTKRSLPHSLSLSKEKCSITENVEKR